MVFRMAPIASQSGVLTFKPVTGLIVIEALDIPLDQREVFPVMFGVTARTLLARAGIDVVGRMQALV